MPASYLHTNLIAADWRLLAAFYTDVFGCTFVPPQRDLSGPHIDAGTGVAGAHLEGVHLRLPGHGVGGPTLEILSYNVLAAGSAPAVNRPGFAHLAFAVPDVETARAEVQAHGGRAVGAIVTVELPGGARITWCYVADPEGNIIELQRPA
jgi:predicted enzyme related to lactoylglutathione lyase